MDHFYSTGLFRVNLSTYIMIAADCCYARVKCTRCEPIFRSFSVPYSDLSPRPSKGVGLVALSHSFMYQCRLTNGSKCRCRSIKCAQMSPSLQVFFVYVCKPYKIVQL